MTILTCQVRRQPQRQKQNLDLYPNQPDKLLAFGITARGVVQLTPVMKAIPGRIWSDIVLC